MMERLSSVPADYTAPMDSTPNLPPSLPVTRGTLCFSHLAWP
jgi:hypothetical protein